MMHSFQELFEAYGADYQATMTRFMGNETMYFKILTMLFQDENYALLGSAIERQDATAAFEAAHALKGVTGNMGLTALYEAVSRLVDALRAERAEEYGQLYQQIQREYQRVEQLQADIQKGFG